MILDSIDEGLDSAAKKQGHLEQKGGVAAVASSLRRVRPLLPARKCRAGAEQYLAITERRGPSHTNSPFINMDLYNKWTRRSVAFLDVIYQISILSSISYFRNPVF